MGLGSSKEYIDEGQIIAVVQKSSGGKRQVLLTLKQKPMFEKHPENSYKCTDTVTWNVWKSLHTFFDGIQSQTDATTYCLWVSKVW